MPEKIISPEDLYRFQVLSGPAISPDGKNIIFSVQRVDKKTEKKYSNLWVVPTESGEPRQFTYGDHVDVSPVWSPDGTQIAFLSTRGSAEKPPQIYILPVFGGEARPLTSLDAEINQMIWSPDGKKLYCAIRKQDKEAVDRAKDPQLSKISTPVRHYDRLFYKLDGYGYLPLERTHIWSVDAQTGKAAQLTDSPVFDESELALSPDGKTLAFFSNRSANPDNTPDLIDLYLMPVKGGDFTKIETPAGAKEMPAFSPDGKWIAYFGQEGIGQGWKNEGLWIVPADGSAPAKCLTAPYDLHCSSWTINDIGAAVTNPPIWSTDSQTLYFPVMKHGASLMMRVAATGGDPVLINGEKGVVFAVSMDRARSKMAFLYGDFTDPGQLYVRDLSSGKEKMLTRFNRDFLDKITLGEVEEVWFKGPDANDLQGWILKPPGFDASKKYPSVLEVHGGPLTQYGFFFMHEFYAIAAQGFVVYFCNPRGGRGYGEKHAQAISGNWGDRDWADISAFTDYVEKLPYIDSARMGITGGSYGGYMTVWAIGHTTRYKAAVSQRCVSNFASMWGSSDFNWSFEQELNNKPPFEDLDYFWKHSPIAYIGNAKTPTLVIHNEMDHRCPIEQSEQVFVALKRLGVETEFVRFPEEFHGLSRNGRTDRRILRLNHITNWFKKYL